MALKERKTIKNEAKGQKEAVLGAFEADELEVAFPPPAGGLSDPSTLRELPPGPIVPKEGTIVPNLGIEELLRQRAAIDALLPAVKLADLDLEKEVVIQYQQAKALLQSVMSSDAPANQKAQVANSCASVLDQLIKMQARLYSAERVKAIEAALIKTLKCLPKETQEAFFVQYERNYEPAAA